MSTRALITVQCPRCGGSGRVPRFGHYARGLCFKCNGAGEIKMRAAPDGTADHEHRLGGTYPHFTDDCGLCHLPVADWPTVVPAHWWGDHYIVYLPGKPPFGAGDVVRVDGESRPRAQAAVRELVTAHLPRFRVKWINRAESVA